ncbi:hypothetical protein F5Y00DRAFT_266146 [Daldinia vernicosa]|uniref:uncharacterized protein n=1 Tax=Daldinia vernicosa TaxID=114800 RepID=UPI002007F79E|nr:uncharacterized protein F5Y00DRAFT_266146 [Daldinia vernicosa]KAI0844824.1 hypothetical protein F5Y00DRAFT_266146 [Daldinia vernicosa]
MAIQTTTVASSSSGTEAEAASNPTTAPSVSVLTLTEKELTTTFTPPASCLEVHLTQLSSPGYELWLNEPQPVPNSKFGNCYPSGYITGYTSGQYDGPYVINLFYFLRCIQNASSSIAPMFSPLVCPEGWNTAQTWANGYIACCADGFQLHLPDTTVDTNRPAYGGTCYSNFKVGQTATVTAYDSASVTATVEWVASATNDQAYAHPIDGFAVSTDDDSGSTRLSGGAIAGIVVGVLVAVIAILVGLLFVLRRSRQKRKQQASFDGSQQVQPQQAVPQEIYTNKEPLTSPNSEYPQTPYTASTGIYEGPTPPYKPTEHYELDSQTPNELDSGWAGGELENREVPAHRRN